MVSESLYKKSILVRFFGHIVPLAIGPPISSPMHKMYIPWHEKGVLEVPHRLEIRQFHSIYIWVANFTLQAGFMG